MNWFKKKPIPQNTEIAQQEPGQLKLVFSIVKQDGNYQVKFQQDWDHKFIELLRESMGINENSDVVAVERFLTHLNLNYQVTNTVSTSKVHDNTKTTNEGNNNV